MPAIGDKVIIRPLEGRYRDDEHEGVLELHELKIELVKVEG